VIAPDQCQFLARIGSDMWPCTHCQFQPQIGSDVDLHCRFWPTPNHFLILKPRTCSEGSSLPVGRNPTMMMPAVMPDSVVVHLHTTCPTQPQKAISLELWRDPSLLVAATPSCSSHQHVLPPQLFSPP
jgi:hypothetical protein